MIRYLVLFNDKPDTTTPARIDIDDATKDMDREWRKLRRSIGTQRLNREGHHMRVIAIEVEDPTEAEARDVLAKGHP